MPTSIIQFVSKKGNSEMFEKLSYFLTLLTLMMLCSSMSARASDDDSSLIFICHKNKVYSRAEVKFAFLGWNDEARAVNNKPLFPRLLKFIKLSEAVYNRSWNKTFFRMGRFKPKILSNDQEVIKYVAASYAGVGYVTVAPTDNPNVVVCGNF